MLSRIYTNQKPAERRSGRGGPNFIDRHVGQRIKEFRQGRGFELETLAGRLGVTSRQLRGYETGAVRIPAGILGRLSDTLGEPVDRFFEGIPGGPEWARDDI